MDPTDGQQFGGLHMFQPKPYFPGNNPKGHSQGKLFADPKPIDEHRYQRGYTPERMQRVREGTDRWNMEGPGHLQGQYRQVIARSTMPLGALSETDHVQHAGTAAHGSPFLQGETRTLMSRDNLMGLPQRGSVNVHIYHGAANPNHSITSRGKNSSPEEMAGTTIIHELGHAHHSHEDFEDFMKTSGHREEYADKFANEHYRPDPRAVRKGNQAHAEDYSYPAMGESRMTGYKGWAKMSREAQGLRDSERAARQAAQPQSHQPFLREIVDRHG